MKFRIRGSAKSPNPDATRRPNGEVLPPRPGERPTQFFSLQTAEGEGGWWAATVHPMRLRVWLSPENRGDPRSLYNRIVTLVNNFLRLAVESPWCK